jgi:hemerythrin-like domain-containing protein
MSDPQSITTALSWDHDRIDHLFEEAATMVSDGELERAEHTFAEAFRDLLRHIAYEEGVLFPFLLAHAPVTGPIAVMRREHAEIQATLERMTLALAHGQGAAFLEACETLEDVLGRHNEKEERVLYPLADRLASRPDAERLLASR